MICSSVNLLLRIVCLLVTDSPFKCGTKRVSGQKSKIKRHWFSYTITDPIFSVSDDIGIALEGDEFDEYLSGGAYGELHKDLDGLKSHRNILGLKMFDRVLKFGLLAEWHATTHKAYAVSATDHDALPVGKNRDIHQFNDEYCEASFFVSRKAAGERAREKSICLDELGSRILIRDIARNDDTVTLISCLTGRKLSSYDTPAVQIIGLGDEPIRRAQALLIVGFLNSRIADFIIRPYVDKHIKGYVLRRVPVPDLSVGTLGAQQTEDVVQRLVELGECAGEKPIWELEDGASLLRELDQAVASWIGITAADLKVVFREFPHIYPADWIDEEGFHDSSTRIGFPPLEQLPDAIWARSEPSPQYDPTAALAAILKSLDAPTPIRTVRLAAVMMLEPHLLTPLLATDQQAQWRRLVGSEAEPHSGNIIGFTARTTPGWNTAITNHRGNGRLIEDRAAGTWAAGAGLESFDTAGWPDGRAEFVLTALSALDIDVTVSSAPDEVRDWIANAAAG